MNGFSRLAIEVTCCSLLVFSAHIANCGEPTVRDLLDNIQPPSVASTVSASGAGTVRPAVTHPTVTQVRQDTQMPSSSAATGPVVDENQVRRRAAQLWDVPMAQPTHIKSPLDPTQWSADPETSSALRLLNRSNSKGTTNTLESLSNVAYPQSTSALAWNPTHQPSAQRYFAALSKAKAASQPQTRARVSKAHAHVDYAFDLMRRGAINSAHDEFVEALWSVAYANGATINESRPVDSLGQALQTLDEADEFARLVRVTDNNLEVRRLATQHQSPGARRVVRDKLDAVAAMQLYYEIAQSSLVDAMAGDGAGAEALYGLARTIQLRAKNGMTTTALAGPRSMALLLAAHEVAPDDYKVSNELGVMYARFGELSKAEKMLKRSLLSREQSESWHNLSRVWQLAGKNELSLYAEQRAGQLKAAGASSTAEKLRFVQAEELVAHSPEGPELPNLQTPEVRTKTSSKPTSSVQQTSWLKNMFSKSVFK